MSLILKGVAMVKPIGFEPTDRSVAGDDLFAALLPMNVLKSVSMYSEEKAKFKRAILERVEAKDKELELVICCIDDCFGFTDVVSTQVAHEEERRGK